MKGISHCLSDAEVVALAEMAHGHVGGDLKAVCLEGGEGNEQGCSETCPTNTNISITSLNVCKYTELALTGCAKKRINTLISSSVSLSLSL